MFIKTGDGKVVSVIDNEKDLEKAKKELEKRAEKPQDEKKETTGAK